MWDIGRQQLPVNSNTVPNLFFIQKMLYFVNHALSLKTIVYLK